MYFLYVLSPHSDSDMRPLLNGSPAPEPISLKAGVTYRFRFMNITLFNAEARIRLLRDGFPVPWRAVAKDGADLPNRLRTRDYADVTVSVGETMDFEFTPSRPGELRLEARGAGGALFAAQRIDVVDTATTSSR